LIDRPAAALARAADGGLTVTPAAPGAFRLGHDPRVFAADREAQHYEAVIATVPSDVFAALLDDGLRTEVGEAYLGRLDSIEYHAVLCLLLELDRRFTSHYWTNVADPALPFVGLVEHTNLVEPDRYGGRRFLYVANYLERGHELLSLDAGALLERYLPGLRAVNPAFDPVNGCARAGCTRSPPPSPSWTSATASASRRCARARAGSCWPTRRRSIPRTGERTTRCASGSRRLRRRRRRRGRCRTTGAAATRRPRAQRGRLGRPVRR
ncbi:MAG: hypothetical protein M3370_01595, partial [Actinomycetota bacterium]|nr:hypothetical protein [Actinomycetota bacterium]